MVVVTSFEETNKKVNTAFRKEIEGPVEMPWDVGALIWLILLEKKLKLEIILVPFSDTRTPGPLGVGWHGRLWTER